MNISYQTLIPKKNEMFEELRNVKYNDLKELVYRMQLTYDEIIDILDLKYISTKRIRYNSKPNVYQINEINKTLKEKFT